MKHFAISTIRSIAILYVVGLLIVVTMGAGSDWWKWRKHVDSELSLVREALSQPNDPRMGAVPLMPPRSLEEVESDRRERAKPGYQPARIYRD